MMGAVVIVAGTAVENENRKGKPRKHRKPRDPGDVRDVRDRRRKAVRGKAVRYDTLENKAEPDGECNVGGREPEPSAQAVARRSSCIAFMSFSSGGISSGIKAM